MFPTSAFSQPPLGFPFPGQQPPPGLYQSQFGGVAGFNPQLVPPFQQAPAPRGQSVPANGRQYPSTTGSYGVPPPPPSSSSRRQQHGQYPPPSSSQNYEYRSSHGSKSRKHHKRRSASPGAVDEQGLYSDHEQQGKGQQQVFEGQPEHSQSQSPTFASRSRNEGIADQDHQPQSQMTEGTSADATLAGVARSEEEQATGGSERRKSGSKKKKHHRRDRYNHYESPPTQGAPLEINANNPFQQPYAPQLYPQQQQQQAYFGEYQNELPAQLKVHRQPLYSSYNQAYEESVRRGDVYRKQAKRSTRLPPEVKQQLLPHEDDRQKQPTPQPQTQQSQQPQQQQQQQSQQPPQQSYPYGPVPGYPQQPLPPYGGIRPPFNPYQPYGAPPNQPNFYGPTPFNAIQPWSGLGPVAGSAEQEIQRLRSHIHTLEGELHKLQRKLNKTSLNNNDGASEHGGVNQEEGRRSHRRSKKRDVIASPRQTPVIVELNNTPGESVRGSSKKHRRRTTSNTSSQQGHQAAQTDSTSVQRSAETTNVAEITSAAGVASGQSQQAADARERSRSGGPQVSEANASTRTTREETAAQLAHAAAAHIQTRQGAVGIVPPPPPAQQQQQLQQQLISGPPPPPVPQVNRPQLPNQQQQQQQFLYQQGVLPPQGQQLRGPAPRLPGAGAANIRFPGDPFQQQQQLLQQQQFVNPQQQQQQQQQPQFVNPQQQFVNPQQQNQQFINPQQQQQFVNPQQRTAPPNPNYNQSNNNELLDNGDDDNTEVDRRKQEQQNRSAEKILDAFERFYVNRGRSSTVPMKVKYIPDDITTNSNTKSSNHFQQRNTNNNNRYRSSSRQTRSSSSASESKSIYSNSPLSSRRSLYDNYYHHHQPKSSIGPFI